MARRTFRSATQVLGSELLTGLGQWRQKEKTDRVLHSNGLEDMIYGNLRRDDPDLDELEQTCLPRLKSFPSLERDVFQSFYSLSVRKNPEEELTEGARQFNAPILSEVMAGDDYRAIKSVCEGEELPAYEAAGEFVERIADDLDGLMEAACGKDCKSDLIDQLQAQHDDLCEEAQGLAEQWRATGGSSELECKLLRAANSADSKGRQVAALQARADRSLQKNMEDIRVVLKEAAASAVEKARECHETLVMWGSDPTDPHKGPLNRALMEQIKASPRLQEISRRLGRLLDLVAQGRRNGYTYGRGEKYTIEYGNKLSRVLPSEFASLARPETTVLFLHKYQRKALKQYKKREPALKGAGDIIMCMDDSISTAGKDNAWGKAAAMALLHIARNARRKFALIHFSSAGEYHTDVFLPGRYGPDDMMRTAELFLGGGTDYETPLRETLRLMDEEGFQKADVLFTTDGECVLPEPFQEEFKEAQRTRDFQVTGILLNQSGPGFSFSLEPFCKRIYRTSELTMEEIAADVVKARV